MNDSMSKVPQSKYGERINYSEVRTGKARRSAVTCRQFDPYGLRRRQRLHEAYPQLQIGLLLAHQ
jgi:hypothetical protein